MNIEELTYAIEDEVLPFETTVKVLINGIKYDIDYLYRERITQMAACNWC